MKPVIAAVLLLGLVGPAFAQAGMKTDAMAPMAKAAAVKSLAVKLDGKVKAPASFTLAQLKALPKVTVAVDYAEQGKSRWSGASLMAIIEKAGTTEPKGHGAYLQHLILARGTDGYGAGIAIGELDPKFAGKVVIIAYEKDGKPLDSLRLIVPGDAHAGRGVRDLAEITVQ